MSGVFRCASSSRERGEDLIGTASTVRAFMIVESPGPWGSDAVRENRLPEPLRSRLAPMARAAGVRALLMRPHGRVYDPGHPQVFIGHTGPTKPWLETVMLEAPEDLLDIDLSTIAEDRSAGLEPHDGPLFLVCTHGKHDVCCAERGRPLVSALAARYPEETWEVSHLGGDRFAGNILVLPDGLYFGRAEPEDAVALAERYLRGELDLAHFRGRCAYGFAIQAAEVYLRHELGIVDKAALRLTQRSRSGDLTRATFHHDRQSWTVTVHTGPSESQRLTCKATIFEPAPRHRLVGIEAASQRG